MATATRFAEQGQRLQFAPKQGGAPQVDAQARTADVILITEGLGNLRDKNYYTADAVTTAARVFDRKQFYVDHPSSIDEESRPERSVRDLAGWFSNCRVGAYEDPDTGEKLTACYATLNFAESEPGQLAMDQVKSALRFQQQNPGSKDVYCGISINAGGLSEPGTIELGGQDVDVNVVHEIEDAFSADIVTKPARGGRFLSMSESEKSDFERVEALAGKALGTLLRESLAGTSAPPTDGEKKETEMTKVTKKDAAKPKVTLALSEAERERLKALKAKGEGKLSEAEAKELKGLRKKITEAAAKKVEAEGGKGYAKPPKVAVTSEGEGEEESEDEAHKRAAESEDEQEAEDSEAEGDSEQESEDEEEAEGGKGYKRAGSILGEALRKIEAYMGEAEGDSEGEEEAEDSEGEEEAEDGHDAPADSGAPVGDEKSAGPEDPSDPMSVLQDIYKDLQNLAELLGGAGDEQGAPAGDGMMGAEDEGEAKGPAMRYGCAACGETNEVLPPKGFRMVRHSESAKSAAKDKSALREAVKSLSTRLAKKEGRFVETNQKVKTLIQENTSLKAKLAARSRADRAAKVLREAKVPADILSVRDLIEFEPAQWSAQIKMAKRVIANESLGGGATPKGGSYKGTQQGEGAKAAIAAFEAADQR